MNHRNPPQPPLLPPGHPPAGRPDLRGPGLLCLACLDSPGNTPGPSGVAAGLPVGVVAHGESEPVWNVPESTGTQK